MIAETTRRTALALALLLAGCEGDVPDRGATPPPTAGASPPARELDEVDDGRPQRLSAVDLRVKGSVLHTEIARTDAQRHKGLMYRRDLGDDEAMLFVYPAEEFRSFWMKNTPLPLSIAFIARDGRITQIADMQPFDLGNTESREAVALALEVHQGWFRAHGIKEGDRIEGLERVAKAEE